ncbi:MAG: flippase, partial [Sphingobacteriales bacterium]
MSTLKKNFFYNSILTLSTVLTPIISFPYIARVLDPGGIGMVSFANTFIQYFLLLSALGMPYYGIREIAKTNSAEERTRVVAELTIIRFLITTIAIIIYIATVLVVPKLAQNAKFYWWGILTLFFGIFDINWFFSGLNDFKYIALRSVVFQVIQVLAYLVFVRNETDTFVYFTIPILVTLLNTLTNLTFIRKYLTRPN